MTYLKDKKQATLCSYVIPDDFFGFSLSVGGFPGTGNAGCLGFGQSGLC